ncbi:MAG: hypothetical protein IJV07_03415 [Alphaproteobacteria bacterium]|nr:hypothetical protein [Alphaproteobacteria bacterium]
MNKTILKLLALNILCSGCVMRQPVLHRQATRMKDSDGNPIYSTYATYEKEYTALGHIYNGALFGIGGGIQGSIDGFREGASNTLGKAVLTTPLTLTKGIGTGLWNGIERGYNITYPEYQALERQKENELNQFLNRQTDRLNDCLTR